MKQNSTSPFIRKIIYIALIGLLLIPLSFISRPEVTDANGQVKDPGGRISQMRRKDRLAQASISEIDPTSEAMKLASMGLRGIAVNVLWMQALEHQKNEDYDKLAATLQTLTKVQPNFVKVWEFQGHNLAFNVSMEFDDYEYRYKWVKKGLEFLKGGISYNMDDHRMTDNMGSYTGTKFGKSDEKLPFRRIFRKDSQFHEAMSDKIAPDSYDAREYGPDTYKMAWHWYDESEKMVDNGAFQFKSDLMFYMHRPAQARQQAMILSEEFRPDEVIREIWEDAGDQWTRFGNVDLTNSSNLPFTLEGVDQYESEIAELRLKLDKLTPGARDREELKVWTQLGMLEDQFEFVRNAATEELNDQQKSQRVALSRYMNAPEIPFDRTVARNAQPEDELEANQIAREIEQLIIKLASISNEGSIINYSFWKSRNTAESADVMIRARQAMHDAREMKRKSIFEDEYVFDYETGEKQITRLGAGKLYEEAFAKWDDVLQDHVDLIDTPVMVDLVTGMREYHQLMLFSGKNWPNDFVLQWVVDERAKAGEDDELPTSAILKAWAEDAEDAAEDDEDDSEMDSDSDAESDAEAEQSTPTEPEAEGSMIKSTEEPEAVEKSEAGSDDKPEVEVVEESEAESTVEEKKPEAEEPDKTESDKQ